MHNKTLNPLHNTMYSSVLHAQDVQCSRVFFNKRLFTYSIQPLFPGYNYCVILFD